MIEVFRLIPLAEKIVLTQVIAPHGITDIVHAQTNNKMNQLLTCYSGNLAATTLLHQCKLDVFLWPMFIIGSYVHFKHDIDLYVKNRYYGHLVNGLFLGMMIQYPLLFYSYMTAIHVPNHYKNAWPYIQEHKWTTLMLLVCTGGASYVGYGVCRNVFMQYDLIIGIILGHVTYQEVSVHKSF